MIGVVTKDSCQTFHTSVMPDQVIQGLKCSSGKLYIDCTLGGGGHSSLIASHIKPDGKLISFDVDEDAIKVASEKLSSFDNVQIVKSNFSRLPEKLSEFGLDQVNGGILMDLGVSSFQLTNPAKGFTFQFESPLDMRMDKELKVTAEDLVNSLSEEELGSIFKDFGEERYSKRIARLIVEQSKIKRITTTLQLANIVKSIVPRSPKMKIHPATRVFQALRIKVNDELGILSRSIDSVIDLMAPGARLAIISFHSLEDRIVKQAFKTWSVDCICPSEMIECRCNHERKLKIITKKPIVPDDIEIKSNPASRSAKLRVAERV